MAKPGQNMFKFKPLSAGHKDGTVTSQRLFRKDNNAFADIRPFTCNLRSSKKNFQLSQRPGSLGTFDKIFLKIKSHRRAYPSTPCVAILLEVPFAAFAKRPLVLRFTWCEGDGVVVTERL